ncbi:MAG: amidase [Rhodospirillaceae bacterium]|nr:amidase [Rhodospirillaceae bacterium]
MKDTVGAFVPDGMFRLDGASEGPLAGTTFAAKDIIDVAGRTTSCGNPDWLRTHGPAKATASVILRCLDAGASLVGKTVTEEFATGLTGENIHHGTPLNLNAPGRVSGGSSSGSAAAVTAGLVDFALGSDTGGSVRSPASFCGIYGIRPTHDRVATDGVMSLSRSLDVIGWFANDPELLSAVGAVLFHDHVVAPSPGRFFVAEDLMELLDERCRGALMEAIDSVAALLGEPEPLRVADDAPIAGLDAWALTARTLWGREAWAEHGAWMLSKRPKLGSGVAARFEARARVTAEEAEEALVRRDRISAYLDDLLADGNVIALPAAPGTAPPIGGSDADIDPFRAANEPIGALSGLGQLPEIVLPLAEVDGLPLGLGLAAARGNDEMLLDLALELHSAGVAPTLPIPK